MDRLQQVLKRLDRQQFPSGISFHRSGAFLAAAISPASHEAHESYQSRIWRFTRDGAATRLTDGPNGDASPVYSPLDDRLAFTSDRRIQGKSELFLLENRVAQPLGNVPGTIEALCWSPDATSLIVQAADRGLDGGVTNGAVRLWWDGTDDPVVTNPTDPLRRLYRVRASDGEVAELGPKGLSIWEFDLLGDGAVALVSADSSERGWYHARVARLDFKTRSATILVEPQWQTQSPTASPSGDKIAFVEGWSSDRGLVAGEIRVLDLKTGSLSSLGADTQTSISTLQWRDAESLWFAGWSGLGSTYGVVRLDGSFEWIEREDAVIGPNSFTAAISPTPDKKELAAIREAVGQPPEIVIKPAPALSGNTAAWKNLTALNRSLTEDYPAYPEVREVSWYGADGLSLEALVLLPPDRKPGPMPTVVDIHGGPTWSSKHAFDPGYALPLVAAGYVVFLPNYRGSAGWGQAFAKLNIGDPGGAEFQDIMTGIDWCVAQGFTDSGRLGVTGGSYGGYLTAWAVATTARFKAAVMASGISNQWSCHYSCNHDFHGFINGGPLTDPKARQIAIERSPLYRLSKPVTPTLILHGIEDRATPLGQGQEFYNALREHGVHTELVAYPREGHGNREREHKADAWRRTIQWFDRFLQ